MVTVKKPVGCSTSRSIGPSDCSGRTAISYATDPGSTQAVATDTAPSTPMASCTRCGMNVRVDTAPPCAGGDSRLIFGTVLSVTSPRFISGPAASLIASTRLPQRGVALELRR